jgi:hypothetical protein
MILMISEQAEHQHGFRLCYMNGKVPSRPRDRNVLIAEAGRSPILALACAGAGYGLDEGNCDTY